MCAVGVVLTAALTAMIGRPVASTTMPSPNE